MLILLICYVEEMLNSPYVFEDFPALTEEYVHSYFFMQNAYNAKQKTFKTEFI